MCPDNFLTEMGKNSLTLNKPNFYFYFWKITTGQFYNISLDLQRKQTISVCTTYQDICGLIKRKLFSRHSNEYNQHSIGTLAFHQLISII